MFNITNGTEHEVTWKKIEEMTEKKSSANNWKLLAKVFKDTADEMLPRLSEYVKYTALIERPNIFQTIYLKEGNGRIAVLQKSIPAHHQTLAF